MNALKLDMVRCSILKSETIISTKIPPLPNPTPPFYMPHAFTTIEIQPIWLVLESQI